MIADVDCTTFPPAELLPADVAELIAARDAAHAKLTDFEDEWHDVLRDDWLTLAEAADIRNAVAAAQAGKDAFKGASEVDKARTARPRVQGVHQVLTAELRNAERAALKAFRPVAAGLEPGLRDALADAAVRAEDAYRAYLEARGEFGGIGHRVMAVRSWANHGGADWLEGEATPQRADGRQITAENPIAEIREVLESFDAPQTFDPMMIVRRDDGLTLELRESQARALVGSANSDPSLRIVGPAE